MSLPRATCPEQPYRPRLECWHTANHLARKTVRHGKTAEIVHAAWVKQRMRHEKLHAWDRRIRSAHVRPSLPAVHPSAIGPYSCIFRRPDRQHCHLVDAGDRPSSGSLGPTQGLSVLRRASLSSRAVSPPCVAIVGTNPFEWMSVNLKSSTCAIIMGVRDWRTTATA